MPRVAIVHVNVVEELGQVAELDVERHVLAEVVDEARHLAVAAEEVLDDVAVAEVLDVVVRVDEAVEERRVAGEVLRALRAALLVGHAVLKERRGELVDRDKRHLEHSPVEPHHEEALPAFVAACLTQIDSDGSRNLVTVMI